jgi:8-oxo-dGTP pyrophosphatase MutT (NUDIX family)
VSPRRKGGTAGKARGRAKHESSAGGVVYRMADGKPLFLLIRDSYGNWGFPKGHLEKGERADAAALREVLEETGLQTATVAGPIAKIDWWFRLHGDLIHKNCEYFLMQTSGSTTRPQESEGISACRWATIEEANELISYKNAREVLQRANELVLSAPRKPALSAPTG